MMTMEGQLIINRPTITSITHSNHSTALHAIMEMQNANPTILNISDLPTRKPAPSARPRSCLTSLVPRYAVDPFTSPSHSDEDGQDDQEEGEDDGIVDRIDAQEIYGSLPPPPTIASRWHGGKG